LQSKIQMLIPQVPRHFFCQEIDKICHAYCKEHNLKKNVIVALLTIGCCNRKE